MTSSDGLDFAPVTAGADYPKPARQQVRDHLAALAHSFGLPRELVHAVAQTQSAFDIGGARRNPETTADFGPESKRYGVMQVSDDHVGETVRGPGGAPFQIGDDIKTDWQANARAGVALLARHYQLAELENPFGSLEEWAQQAYSGYSADNSFRGRYLTTLSDDLPAHPRDRAFLRNFRKAAPEGRREEKQPQAQSAQQSSTEQQAQNQTRGLPARPSEQSGSAPLPGPLQRLKENPGDLFLQTPAPLDEKNAARPTFRGIDLVPSLSNAPSRTRSLGDIASLLSSQEGTRQPIVMQLPAPLRRLKEDPADLFLEPFMRGWYFSAVNLNEITQREGGNQPRPYFPGRPERHPNSGLTIGKGVDLTQNRQDDLKGMGVPQTIIDKLSLYFGKNAQDAYRFALEHKNDPPPLSQSELEQLNRAVMSYHFNAAGKAYDEASPIANLRELPWQAQTVIADLWYNRGDLRVKAPVFWKQVITGRWEDAVHLLEHYRTGDQRLDDRAKADAALLKQALDANLLPKPEKR